MKKSLKIIIPFIIILILFILLDTLQAIIFNNAPLLKTRKNYNDSTIIYVDKGIIVNHYYYANKEKSTLFKTKKAQIINNTNNVKTTKFSKEVASNKIELTINNTWHYEEVKPLENDNFEFALKIYKDNKNRNFTLYYFKDSFAVCGTGRTNKKLKLSNNYEANIGYYEKNFWTDVSIPNLNNHFAFINYNLNADEEKEALNIIKTFNIR